MHTTKVDNLWSLLYDIDQELDKADIENKDKVVLNILKQLVEILLRLNFPEYFRD